MADTRLVGNPTVPSQAPSEPVTVPSRLGRAWFWLSLTVALLAAVASAVGLFQAQRLYGQETAALFDQASAQDLVTLLVVAPQLALVALLARGGSFAAFLCLPGYLAFTTYNYAIYAFSIHFGPLFLGWVLILGLSLLTLVGIVASADRDAIKQRFGGRAELRTAGLLVVVGVLFVLLWMSEIVPELLTGASSAAAASWNVPTSPVHVLDLAFFLPGLIATGILLARRHPLGYTTAAGQLVWLALTCVPILVTPLVANARGHDSGWTVMVPIGVLLLALGWALARLLRRLDARRTEVSEDAVS